MNLDVFNELWKQGRPSQHLDEWRMFLESCEMYLKKHEIANPIVVELGTDRNKQKRFYEHLLGAEHIGIDISRKRHPDIHGNTHDPRTLQALKEKLKERLINILFVDTIHSYEQVKKDFEIYSPLCNDIVAFHDINLGRYQNKAESREVWKFWDELKGESFLGIRAYKNFLFVSIEREMGIGMIIKK